ncbi:hypothetical protein [Gynuella sunshinyii]|uniref:Uncharacterized protein n=1 Tax=Gynuella sunshinyii YC6258 TaxID=1445510 RepID=A0A0C5VE97_9GAMM|nr:hypothetical protein [Gynuella sunshinyii]AJQ92847.1 hypothetical Protein YC6258_00797 [Gynuella sunshinyii YC6258]
MSVEISYYGYFVCQGNRDIKHVLKNEALLGKYPDIDCQLIKIADRDYFTISGYDCDYYWEEIIGPLAGVLPDQYVIMTVCDFDVHINAAIDSNAYDGYIPWKNYFEIHENSGTMIEQLDMIEEQLTGGSVKLQKNPRY